MTGGTGNRLLLPAFAVLANATGMTQPTQQGLAVIRQEALRREKGYLREKVCRM